MRRVALVLLALTAVLTGLGVGSPSAASRASGCPKVPSPKPRTETRKPPKKPLDPHRKWTATLKTSCGSFTIRLDVKDSPHTTASFVSLARSRFYNDTIFHRIVSGFVIQGGDPTQTSSGGPGYSTVDRPPRTTTYTPGTVAMAKAPGEPKGTAGSQFFIVTGDASFLPADYALLGRVVKGMDVVRKIGKLGQPTEQGTPKRIVVVRRISIKSS